MLWKLCNQTAPSTALFLDSTIIEPESCLKAQDVMQADPALFSVFSSAHCKDSSSWYKTGVTVALVFQQCRLQDENFNELNHFCQPQKDISFCPFLCVFVFANTNAGRLCSLAELCQPRLKEGCWISHLNTNLDVNKTFLIRSLVSFRELNSF